MRRPEISDLWRALGRHWNGEDRDPDAALWEIFEMGAQYGIARRRRRSARSVPASSDLMQETVARAIPYVRRIAKWKKISPELLVNGREAAVARERQEAYHILRELPGQPFSFPTIALAFGLKDHTAVIHGCRVVEERIANDPRLRARLRTITRRIGAAS